MFLIFSNARAQAHLSRGLKSIAPVEAGTSASKDLRRRFDELRRLCTGTAVDLAGAQAQADEVGGAWVIDTRDWSMRQLDPQRNAQRDASISAEERYWSDARHLRDGWRRRSA